MSIHSPTSDMYAKSEKSPSPLTEPLFSPVFLFFFAAGNEANLQGEETKASPTLTTKAGPLFAVRRRETERK